MRYVVDLLSLLKSYDFIEFGDCSAPSLQGARSMRSEADLKEFYRQESAAWKAANKDRRRIEINILQDCDDGVLETVETCVIHAALGLKSTTALFARWAYGGPARPYEIDFEHLAHLQARGLQFSYHANAWEMSGYDEGRLADTFNADLDTLTAHGIAIDAFSPHGGKSSPDGRTNATFFSPAFANRPLVWTHNRIAPGGQRQGDGALWPRLQSGDPTSDIRNHLLKHLAFGRRHWILFHPQYYSAAGPERATRISAAPWTGEYWYGIESGRPLRFWEPVRRHLDKLAEERAIAHAA